MATAETTAGMATAETTAEMATAETTEGMATAQTTAGMATAETTAGMATVGMDSKVRFGVPAVFRSLVASPVVARQCPLAV
jgi:hypothetical protein